MQSQQQQTYLYRPDWQRRLIQEIHNRLAIPRIKASGIVVLLVRRNDSRRILRRRQVDSVADGLRRLLAVVEARDV